MKKFTKKKRKIKLNNNYLISQIKLHLSTMCIFISFYIIIIIIFFCQHHDYTKNLIPICLFANNYNKLLLLPSVK